MPKEGDEAWLLNTLFDPVRNVFYKDNKIFQSMLEKGLLFPTEAECQKFADHCLKYFDKK